LQIIKNSELKSFKKDASLFLVMSQDRIYAIILAGGEGKRLGPLTRRRAKPAVGYGGIYRLIDPVLTNLKLSGVNRAAYVTQFLPGSLRRHISDGDPWGFRDDEGNIHMENFHPAQFPGDEDVTKFIGTAHSVMVNIPRIMSHDPTEILILSGDHIYKEDYNHIVQVHHQSQADCTVYVKPVQANETSHFGIVKINNNGRIIEFQEKPSTEETKKPLELTDEQMHTLGITDPTKRYLASMGIYLFNPETLEEAVLYGKDFGQQVFPLLKNTHNVQSCLFEGYWEDVGRIQSYYDAHQALLPNQRSGLDELLAPVHQEGLPVHLTPLWFNTRLRTKIPPAQVHPSATIINSILSPGCIIEQGAVIRDSILGYQVKVRKGTTISYSIILGADRHYQRGDYVKEFYTDIGEESQLSKVILDKNNVIGPHTQITGMENGQAIPTQERIARLSSMALRSGEHLQEDQHFVIEGELVIIGKGDYSKEKFVIPTGTNI